MLRLPAQAAGEGVLRDVLGQELQDRRRLLRQHAFDTDGIGAVHVESLLPGDRVRAHQRMSVAPDLAQQIIGQPLGVARGGQAPDGAVAQLDRILRSLQHVAHREVHPEAIDHAPIGVAQQRIGQRRIGPDGVAAEGRDLDRIQHRDGRRLGQERRIGVPALPEYHLRLVVGFLDQRMNVAVAGDARGIGVFGKCAEAQAESLVLRVGQLLSAEEDHLVPEQRIADLIELRVAQVRRPARHRFPRPWPRPAGAPRCGGSRRRDCRTCRWDEVAWLPRDYQFSVRSAAALQARRRCRGGTSARRRRRPRR